MFNRFKYKIWDESDKILDKGEGDFKFIEKQIKDLKKKKLGL